MIVGLIMPARLPFFIIVAAVMRVFGNSVVLSVKALYLFPVKAFYITTVKPLYFFPLKALYLISLLPNLLFKLPLRLGVM